MGQPSVTFVIDPKYDIEWVQNLLKSDKKWSSRTGGDVLSKAVSTIPSLKNIKEIEYKKAKVLIENEILTKYKELEEELDQSKKSIEVEWGKIEDNYFQEVKKLFDKCDLPTNDFKVILSILQSFPYHKKENSVHIPYKDMPFFTRTSVLVHENLHLIFFNFCKHKIKPSVNKKILWDLSEIINPIIQNREPFLTMCKFIAHPYSTHAEQYYYLNSVFDKRKSMQSFIEEAIRYLKKFEKENLPYEERIKFEKAPVLNKHEIIEGNKLLLEFNKIMQTGFCVSCKDGIHDIANAKWINPTTLIVPLKNFEKNKEYTINLNVKDYMYFKSIYGKELETTQIKIKIA